MNTTIERNQTRAEPAAEVIADGNGLRLFRALPAGTLLYEGGPQASSDDGEAWKTPTTEQHLKALAAGDLMAVAEEAGAARMAENVAEVTRCDLERIIAHVNASQESASTEAAPCTCCGCGGCKACLGGRKACPQHSLCPTPAPSPLAETGEALARKMYDKYTDNHPTIHCNRFAPWTDLGEAEKNTWRRKASRAALAAPASTPEAPAVVDLATLNGDLIEILGRPNFTCIRLAQALRLCGADIKSKAEHEQATVIHFLLTRYMRHGSDWAKHADADLRAMLDKVEAKNKAAMMPKPYGTALETGEGDAR